MTLNFNLSILTGMLLTFFASHFLQAQNQKNDEQEIRQLIVKFSEYVMTSDYEGIANSYTLDGKIFPNNTGIIEGREAIKKRWTLPESVSIPYHKIIPKEIKVLGDHAYDYGLYEGTTRHKDGSEKNWKGKYVIVWKKINGAWKIYLDIWNTVKD